MDDPVEDDVRRIRAQLTKAQRRALSGAPLLDPPELDRFITDVENGRAVYNAAALRQRDQAWLAAFSALALVWFLMLTGCAHTPDPPPGDACPTWQDGWVEYRPADCAYWRCDAVTRRWERVEEDACRP